MVQLCKSMKSYHISSLCTIFRIRARRLPVSGAAVPISFVVWRCLTSDVAMVLTLFTTKRNHDVIYTFSFGIWLASTQQQLIFGCGPGLPSIFFIVKEVKIFLVDIVDELY